MMYDHTPSDAATERQIDFINTLRTERGLDAIVGDTLSKLGASRMIDDLKATPRKPRVAPAADAPIDEVFVPAGRYAVEVNGVLGFYKVDRPTAGTWAGRTFVKQFASDEQHNVYGLRARVVLAAIADAGPEAASVAYGREIGRCGVCGRTLTDEASRAAGIGPTCSERF